tara:strand:- start:1612 stop:2523 length:912 start_codon:yes stop_codon:yes gene_type:complete
MKNITVISKEVKDAISLKKPIVALESTLISHGLPYPDNIKVANDSINAVRDSGAVAATIGIINGKIKIGLSKNDILILAKDNKTQKVSNHNLALAIFKKQNAATTVASTISIASYFNIKFFATGGIGGIHLGSEVTNDISSDLYALSEYSNYVVCSGAKSILDLKKTYEFLETLGITRIGFSTNYMPGFWYSKTSHKVDKNFNNISKICSFLKFKESIGSRKSVLIFNKVPSKYALNKKDVDDWIKISIKKANKQNITGKELTPFLINEINKKSKNKSLKANKALIIKNAEIAGRLSKEYYLT